MHSMGRVIVSTLALMAFAGGVTVAVGTVPALAQSKTIGVAFDFVTPFREAERGYVEDGLTKLGYTMKFTNADRDAQRQASQIDSLISGGVKALIVIPQDIQGGVALAQTAKAEGVPFVSMDQAPASLTDDPYHVGGDPCADGTVAGKFFADQAGGKPFKLLEIQGSLANDNGLKRSSCLDAVLAQHPNIEIVAKAPTDWLPERALTATENALQAHPDLNGIYVPFNDGLQGVFSALKADHRLVPVGAKGHVVMVSIDGDPGGCRAVREDLLDLDIATPLGEMGSKAAQAAVTLAQGGTLTTSLEKLPGLPYGPSDFAQKEGQVWGCQAKYQK